MEYEDGQELGEGDRHTLVQGAYQVLQAWVFLVKKPHQERGPIHSANGLLGYQLAPGLCSKWLCTKILFHRLMC